MRYSTPIWNTCTTACGDQTRKPSVLPDDSDFGPASIAGLGLIYRELDGKRAALAALERALEINPRLPRTRRKVQELHDRLDGRKT